MPLEDWQKLHGGVSLFRARGVQFLRSHLLDTSIRVIYAGYSYSAKRWLHPLYKAIERYASFPRLCVPISLVVPSTLRAPMLIEY